MSSNTSEQPVRSWLLESDKERLQHPAFGLVSASRVSGQANLYGSNVGHSGYIQIRIDTAYTEHYLAKDWYFPGKRLIEINLSEAQWVALISRMNMGPGTPCTISWTEKSGAIPQIASTEKATEKLNADAEKIIQAEEQVAELAIQELKDAIKKLPKNDYAKALSVLETIQRNGRSNRNYHARQLNELTEQLITEAKIEIDAAISAAVTHLGLETIHQLSEILAADPKKAVLLIANEKEN